MLLRPVVCRGIPRRLDLLEARVLETSLVPNSIPAFPGAQVAPERRAMTTRDRPEANKYPDDRCLNHPPPTHRLATPRRNDRSRIGTGPPGRFPTQSQLLLRDPYALESLCASEKPHRHPEIGHDTVHECLTAFAGSPRLRLPSAASPLRAYMYRYVSQSAFQEARFFRGVACCGQPRVKIPICVGLPTVWSSGPTGRKRTE